MEGQFSSSSEVTWDFIPSTPLINNNQVNRHQRNIVLIVHPTIMSMSQVVADGKLTMVVCLAA